MSKGLTRPGPRMGAVNLVACSDGAREGARAPEGPPAGGRYDGPEDAEPEAVCEKLTGDEFILDVQPHHVNPEGPWVENNPGLAVFLGLLRPDCGEAERLNCLSLYYYTKDIFLESDTTMAVLSDLPTTLDSMDSLTFEEMRRTTEIIDRLSSGGDGRLLLPSIGVPNGGAPPPP